MEKTRAKFEIGVEGCSTEHRSTPPGKEASAHEPQMQPPIHRPLERRPVQKRHIHIHVFEVERDKVRREPGWREGVLVCAWCGVFPLRGVSMRITYQY
jgi:hypothetical protein